MLLLSRCTCIISTGWEQEKSRQGPAHSRAQGSHDCLPGLEPFVARPNYNTKPSITIQLPTTQHLQLPYACPTSTNQIPSNNQFTCMVSLKEKPNLYLPYPNQELRELHSYHYQVAGSAIAISISGTAIT